MDFSLIPSLASCEPSWHFVFIGPNGNFDDATREAMEQCRQRPNVQFPAARPAKDLPMCMGALDVALMCYRKDTWMEFGYPLKLHEYLAAGLPVVSTPLESICDVHDWIESADDEQSRRTAIARALDGHGRSTVEARRAVARRNTWDSRVASIDEVLTAAIDGTLTPPQSKTTESHAC